MGSLKKNFDHLNSSFTDIKHHNKVLQEKITDLENLNRKNNLLINGLLTNASETNDSLTHTIKNMFMNVMKIDVAVIIL